MRRLIGLLVLLSAATAAYSQTVRPPATVAERAALYQRIASTDSTAELERLAREAMASKDPVNVSQLELIFDRYFELDPTAAVKLAGELQRAGGSPSFVATLYQRLARADLNDALSALSQLDDLAEARTASMAVLSGLGADERAFDLIAASLQGGALEQFRADALPRLAAASPARALREALALGNPEMRRTLAMTVVSRWANDAPSEAIAAADSIADRDLRVTLRMIVLRSWRDTGSLFTYVEGLPPESLSETLANGALASLTAADPSRAARIVSTLPAGDERTRMLPEAAAAYARRDPLGAVAWARTLSPPAPEIVANAVRFAASRDPLSAFDLAASLDEPQRSQTYLSIANGPLEGAQLPALADRVLRIDDEATRTRLVMTLVEVWANRRNDPQGALGWINANEAVVPPEAYERVAFIFARSDPTGAAAYVDRVPTPARAAWIAAVTLGIATTDVQGATQFLERFRGEPGFDRGAPQLAMRIAQEDPAAAARLIGSVGTRGMDGAAPEFAIARSWAQRDPAAAASWAINLPPLQRSIALQMVTGIWGSQDPEAVRRWALGMPAGDRRDMALTAAMQSRGAAPADAALLAAFSADRPRQAAVMNTILATAQTDTAAARRLIGEHITDPTMRARAEELVASFERGTAPIPTGNPFVVGPTGFARGAIGGVPIGVAPGGVIDPVTIVGPNGQPVTVRRPTMVLPPEPGLIALPPGAVVGPIPPIPPAVEPRPETPQPTRQ